ncbi:MAG: ABC transporter permease subunit [Salinisphaera sp.]|jgi:taurine transport system permease protein|nr:ABC transporter permease subunit [Salinisphaera sp.]
MNDTAKTSNASRRLGLLGRLSRSRPTQPGETYGVPGSGETRYLSAATVIGMLFAWWLITTLGWVAPLFLPSPQAVIHAFITISENGFTNTPLWQHVLVSSARMLVAFFFACLFGIPLGLAIGMSSVARGMFHPLIELYRPIPPLAYLPLMIIWFGIGETSKVLLIYLSCFAPIVLGCSAGVRSASIEQIHAAYSFGATRWQVLRHVILQAALPEILTAMRIGIGFGWTTLVAAELVASREGIGYMVLTASKFLQTGVVIMGIIIIAAIAYLFDWAIRYLEHRLVPWKGKV